MLPDVENLYEALKKIADTLKDKVPAKNHKSVKAVYIFNNKEDYIKKVDELSGKNDLTDDKENDDFETKNFELRNTVEEEDYKVRIIKLVLSKESNILGWKKFEVDVKDFEINEVFELDDVKVELKGTKETKTEKNDVIDYKKLYEEEKNKKLMLLADLDNEKKRLEKQRSELFKMSNIRIVKDLFEIVDDINRATLNDIDKDSLKMILNKFLGTLNNYDVIPIDIKEGSEFDPSKMDALTTIKVEEENQNNKVIHVDQMGFIYKEDNSIIRPAKVIVGKK